MVYTLGEGVGKREGGWEGKREGRVVVFKAMCTNTCMTTHLGGVFKIYSKNIVDIEEKIPLNTNLAWS